MANLEGQAALITGAGTGIGAATAIALAEAGARVALVGRRKDRLDAVAARIASVGGATLVLPADVSDQAQAIAAVDEAARHFGRLDILVNSAGIAWPGTVADADFDHWRRTLDTNLLATLYASSAAIRHMRGQGSGDIINISSMAARRPGAILNPYSVSKAALNSMNYGMREEVAKYGIRLCVLMPGATTTDIADSIPDPAQRDEMYRHVHKPEAIDAADIGRTIAYIVGLPRVCNVSEIHIRPSADTAVVG